MLPEVRASSEVYGETDASTPRRSRSRSPARPAISRRRCSARPASTPGTAKNTYGTGCFMLLNTGDKPVPSKNGLLTTVGWQVGGKVDLLPRRRGVHRRRRRAVAARWPEAINSSAEVEQLCARPCRDADGVYLVPAFVGLGAPYWDPYARGLDHRHHARHDDRPHRAGGGRSDGVSDRATCSKRCSRRPACS